jgi:hypothetical protein
MAKTKLMIGSEVITELKTNILEHDHQFAVTDIMYGKYILEGVDGRIELPVDATDHKLEIGQKLYASFNLSA